MDNELGAITAPKIVIQAHCAFKMATRKQVFFRELINCVQHIVDRVLVSAAIIFNVQSRFRPRSLTFNSIFMVTFLRVKN